MVRVDNSSAVWEEFVLFREHLSQGGVAKSCSVRSSDHLAGPLQHCPTPCTPQHGRLDGVSPALTRSLQPSPRLRRQLSTPRLPSSTTHPPSPAKPILCNTLFPEGAFKTSQTWGFPPLFLCFVRAVFIRPVLTPRTSTLL